MWMFDLMWQMASLGGHWYVCLDSPECCGGVDTFWDTHRNLGNLLFIWSWIPIKKDRGMLGVCLPWWGEAPSIPSVGNVLTRDQITYLLVSFFCEPCALICVFIWIQLELLSCFDIKHSNANMPNRKSHRSKKRTLKQESPATSNGSSGPSKVDHQELEAGMASPCQVGRHWWIVLKCILMGMYRILNLSIWVRNRSERQWETRSGTMTEWIQEGDTACWWWSMKPPVKDAGLFQSLCGTLLVLQIWWVMT